MLAETLTTNRSKTSTQVRTATPRETARVVGLITLAFSTDPVARWVYPEHAEYLEHFPKFIRAFAGESFASGAAFVNDNFSGAALWLPPENGPDEDALTKHAMASTRGKVQFDLFHVFEGMAEYHPSEPHWYLPMTGVDTQFQGLGIGSQLMEFALDRCDRDGLPAYLESSNQRNIPLYERYGFRRLGTIQFGDSAPLFPMIKKVKK